MGRALAAVSDEPMGLTPLVSLASLGPELYAKLEYVHPSNSMKHRAIPPLLEAKKRQGAIASDAVIAVLSAGAGAVSVAWAASQLGHRALTVLPRDAPSTLARLIRWMGATCVQIEASEVAATIARLRADPEIHLMSQSQDPEIVDYYRPVAREIMTQLPEVAAIVVGIGTGASITGIGREVKDANGRCRVVGVEPSEAQVARGGSWAPHTIYGLAAPMPQVLLDKSLIAEIVPIPSREAWRSARDAAQKVGLFVGPSSGATIAAALALRARGERGPIVAVCACSMMEYIDAAPDLGDGDSRE